MNNIERLGLIDQIGRELQQRMTTTDIYAYLGGFGVKHDNKKIVESKWIYVKSLLGNVDEDRIINIAKELGLEVPMSLGNAVIGLKAFLAEGGLVSCQEDFDRALKFVDSDPPTAIGMASTTLESICKAILDECKEKYPKDESLQPLLKSVFSKMDLSPDGHADPDIKRILGGLFNAGVGLATLRTKFSAAHGRGKNQIRLGARHARLAVHSLSTVGLFLLETYFERFANQQPTLHLENQAKTIKA